MNSTIAAKDIAGMPKRKENFALNYTHKTHTLGAALVQYSSPENTNNSKNTNTKARVMMMRSRSGEEGGNYFPGGAVSLHETNFMNSNFDDPESASKTKTFTSRIGKAASSGNANGKDKSSLKHSMMMNKSL